MPDDRSPPAPSPPGAAPLRDPVGKPHPRYLSPGARKEKLRQREVGRVRRATPRYAELRAASAFSFLRATAQPEELVARAAELELPAVALVDRGGVYGAPRFYQAARRAGIRARVGAEVVLSVPAGTPATPETPRPARGPGNGPPPKTAGTGPAATAGGSASAFPTLTLLVESRKGYGNLCRLLTAAAAGKPKGEAAASWQLVATHAEGLCCLTGGAEGPVARALVRSGTEAARAELERLAWAFPGRLWVELQRHRRPEEERRNQALVELARALRLPIVATNGVRYARAEDKPLQDVLTCIREHTPLDLAGSLLAAERQRHLKSAAEMERLFADLPQAIGATVELADRLDFTLADLGYRFPDYPLPPGETASSYLRHLAWNGARARFRPLTARAQRQVEKELALIEKLDLAGYFLIVHDIVRFCQERGILVQGRGSAANSAVCYALSITAVDPVRMELLFERFLSEERGEWPDIDLDLPSGDQREEVIQHVYRRYGPHGAAMTANVITYRDRSAAREVAKALGYSADQEDRLAKQLGGWSFDGIRGDPKELGAEIAAAGFDPAEPRVRLFAEMWQRIQNLPRHLGQHSGGMVLAAGRLDEIVPLEPAAMPGRVVVQWDKDDCADLGLIKVDLLGLGMLGALAEVVPLIREHEGKEVDLAHLPPDDPETYRMLRAADTVGVFQVESRAQMASLPRNAPRRFYDLVVQVAIIRPGPIVGGMVHPYFERRQGREPVTYRHPCLEPVLERTLGVPLFQEQILRMAMVTAGFSGGEAEELRRAMGFKRSVERMHAIERRLRDGMTERGITGETQDAIVEQITSFALYGFPESHAASFALIAYASAWLKAHHPTAFLIALLNAWPMGFYHPSTLVRDAMHHGVRVLPIDVDRSGWGCRWEEGACRLGLRFLKGLRQATGERIAAERARGGPFRDVEDLARRCTLRPDELTLLAHVGALGSLGLTRRQALWQAALAARDAGPLFGGGGRRPPEPPGRQGRRQPPEPPGRHGGRPLRRRGGSAEARPPSPLPEMSAFEETLADFATAEMTTGTHPVAYLREHLAAHGVTRAIDCAEVAHGATVRIAGSVIVRQRPGTAKGLVFATLEDETGTIQTAVMPDLLKERRQVILRSPGLVIEGRMQTQDGHLTVRADRIWPLPMTRIPSHDFH